MSIFKRSPKTYFIYFLFNRYYETGDIDENYLIKNGLMNIPTLEQANKKLMEIKDKIEKHIVDVVVLKDGRKELINWQAVWECGVVAI
jgi:hypothetical protein